MIAMLQFVEKWTNLHPQIYSIKDALGTKQERGALIRLANTRQLLLLVNSTGVRVLAVIVLESRRISQELSNNLIF